MSRTGCGKVAGLQPSVEAYSRLQPMTFYSIMCVWTQVFWGKLWLYELCGPTVVIQVRNLFKFLYFPSLEGNLSFQSRVTNAAWFAWDILLLAVKVLHPGKPLSSGLFGGQPPWGAEGCGLVLL